MFRSNVKALLKISEKQRHFLPLHLGRILPGHQVYHRVRAKLTMS
jgi:hypothetical protein